MASSQHSSNVQIAPTVDMDAEYMQTMILIEDGWSDDDWSEGMLGLFTEHDPLPRPIAQAIPPAPSRCQILNYGGLLSTLNIASSHSAGALHRVPGELRKKICQHVFPDYTHHLKSSNYNFRRREDMPHPAEMPPATGACPLIERLPAELRERMFLEALPARDVVIEPTCGVSSPSLCTTFKREPVRNTTSDYMTLNKKIKKEVSHIVYQERTFRIHVHPDLNDGGIEFLDSGRQPLQFKDEVEDARFARFRTDDEFGFARLKKIEVAIFSPTGDSKHSPMNAYYMNLALVKLLERSGIKNKITSVTITFPSEEHGDTNLDAVGRRNIMKDESGPWWNPEDNEPRSSSTFGVPDIEFVLRPFANLSSHNVRIALPGKCKNHPRTIGFVTNLMSSMTTPGKWFVDPNQDDFEMRMNYQRAAFEEYLFRHKHGTKQAEWKMSEAEWAEADQQGPPKRLKLVTNRGRLPIR